MYAAAPRADVGGGALAGALMALITFVMAPSLDNFDFNVIFGAVGVILPFFAGYMPRKWKTIYMSLVGILALAIVAGIEFLLTGTLAEATKSMAPPLLTALFISYIVDPKHPEEERALSKRQMRQIDQEMAAELGRSGRRPDAR